MPKALRSVLAVLAGYFAMAVAVVVFTVACVKALHLQSGHPTPGYLVANLVYSLLAAVLGGWVAAKIAGYRPLQHGLALGLLMLIHPAPGQPLWYAWALTLGSPLMAVLGTKVAQR